jgi:hypothetical protein
VALGVQPPNPLSLAALLRVHFSLKVIVGCRKKKVNDNSYGGFRSGLVPTMNFYSLFVPWWILWCVSERGLGEARLIGVLAGLLPRIS